MQLHHYSHEVLARGWEFLSRCTPRKPKLLQLDHQAYWLAPQIQTFISMSVRFPFTDLPRPPLDRLSQGSFYISHFSSFFLVTSHQTCPTRAWTLAQVSFPRPCCVATCSRSSWVDDKEPPSRQASLTETSALLQRIQR